MKSCIYCGNTLEDQAQFCNVCGQRQPAPQYQAPQYQQPQYQQPQYQAPQYQQPQYQAPQYQQPQYRAPYAPVRPASPNFVPPVNTIGLFNLLGAIVTTVLGYGLNFLLQLIGIFTGGWFFSLVLPWVWSAIYVLITWIGFSSYNKACVRNGYPQKKLSIGWLFLIWLIREVFSFVFGFIWGAFAPLLYRQMSVMVISVIVFAWNLVTNIGSALLTWLVGNAILKSVVKNK